MDVNIRVRVLINAKLRSSFLKCALINTIPGPFDFERYYITADFSLSTNCLWLCGVLVITTAQLHSTKSERFRAGVNSARGVSEIRYSEDF